MSVHQFIQDTIDQNPVVLFMKGEAMAPMCGFSAYVARVLQHYGVEFKDVNVLETEELRQGIKDFTNWPTIPQLYVNGEFIGGADIVRDMHEEDELAAVLKKAEE